MGVRVLTDAMVHAAETVGEWRAYTSVPGYANTDITGGGHHFATSHFKRVTEVLGGRLLPLMMDEPRPDT
jgi:hypothetical protein